MSTGPIVTIGGQEVYYAGRPQRSPVSVSLAPEITRGVQSGDDSLRAPGVKPVFLLALAAALLIALTAIMTRNSRRSPR